MPPKVELKASTLAGTRALVQILILASIILIIFEKTLFWSFPVLVTMASIAGHYHLFKIRKA